MFAEKRGAVYVLKKKLKERLTIRNTVAERVKKDLNLLRARRT